MQDHVTVKSTAAIDFDRFRLRKFIERLIQLDEVEIHHEPVALADMSALIEATPKATLFKKAGAEQHEVVAAVTGSRRRLAAAFGVSERELAHDYMRRMATPQDYIEVPSADAPVHEVILQGDDIDLTKLPFHLQHEFDGGPYISSAIDYSTDPATGKNNVGCRRLMLRNRNTVSSNLTAPSDMQRIYRECIARKQRLPISFAVGSHPLDFLAATLRGPGDEFKTVATFRGATMPMVRGLTNGVLAPADAEMIIEGYFDELGFRVYDGPFGEFWGFYGPAHPDPLFHVTAICMRKDMLHQTVLHGTSRLDRVDSCSLSSVHTEAAVIGALRAAGVEPAAVCSPEAAAPRQHIRVALKRGKLGESGRAMDAVLAMRGLKHVTVVDDDIDVFSDAEMEWAMSARFRADQDLVLRPGQPAYYADPTATKEQTVTKVGYDLTAPYDIPDTLENLRPYPPRLMKPARYQTVQQALESGPMYFGAIMEGVGSRDGREIAIELDTLTAKGVVSRMPEGQWCLKTTPGAR
jgi:UbiD family decarboxylase